MSLIAVDRRKCVKCGTCAEACPVSVLAMNDAGPYTVREKNCIGCGHCTAICPRAAMDHTLNPLARQSVFDRGLLPSAASAALLLRSRRSTRNYSAEKIPREVVCDILETAQYAPTAGNTLGITFQVIDEPELLKRIASTAITGIEEFMEHDPPLPETLARMVAQYKYNGIDTALRGAPCLVLALVDRKQWPAFRENGRFMIGYAELYAHALGLGCCRVGFIDVCVFGNYKPLCDLLQIPADKLLSGSFVMGYPKHEFVRCAARPPARVKFMEN